MDERPLVGFGLALGVRRPQLQIGPVVDDVEDVAPLDRNRLGDVLESGRVDLAPRLLERPVGAAALVLIDDPLEDVRSEFVRRVVVAPILERCGRVRADLDAGLRGTVRGPSAQGL